MFRVDEQVRRVSSTGEWEDAQEGKKSVSFANRLVNEDELYYSKTRRKKILNR